MTSTPAPAYSQHAPPMVQAPYMAPGSESHMQQPSYIAYPSPQHHMQQHPPPQAYTSPVHSSHSPPPGAGQEIHMQQLPHQGYPIQQSPPPMAIAPDSDMKHAHTYSQQPPQPQQPQYVQPQPRMAPLGNYNSVTPLHALQRSPAPVDCPCCGQREMTRVTPQAGNSTHAWAAIVCFVFCLGCIPYMMSSLKDMDHHCVRCGVLLATWHNSGRVVVHQYARS